MNLEKITPGVWFGVAIIAGIGFALGWALGRDFGGGRMQPDPYDGELAVFYERHLFKRNERVELRLMRLPEYELVDAPVWAAKGKNGRWYPFFREDYGEPEG